MSRQPLDPHLKHGPGLLLMMGLLALGWLMFRAADASWQVPGANPWLVVADLIVGVAFVVAGLGSGFTEMRILVITVGVSWLVGSWLPGTGLIHQAVLAVALTVFPQGRPKGATRWTLVVAALGVGLGLIPQGGVALLFAGIAALALLAPEGGRLLYPTASAAGVALVLGGSWILSQVDPEAFDPGLALLLYQMLLVVIAAGFPLGARSLLNSKAKLTDLVLADNGLVGLDGLASVLAEALHDPELKVYRWQDLETLNRPADDIPRDGREVNRHWLQVLVDQKPIAAVSYRSPALDDPETMEAVSNAVRLSVRHLQLEERLHVELSNLEAARARLVAATDRQRQGTANRLRQDVITVLGSAKTELKAVVEHIAMPEGKEALAIAADELAQAEREIEMLVAGVPPAQLGNGRLQQAVAALAKRNAVPVLTMIEPGAAADAEIETALFYVCSEALTNATKHSRAGQIVITIAREGDEIVLRVSDDGSGGADASGSGLQGLADRLAASRGRLHIDSAPGAGTTVTAIVPCEP